MPIYEFDCHDCGDSFESLVISFSAIDRVTCPACESKNIKKKLSTFAVKGNQGGSNSFAASSAPSCSPGGV
ncbi:MAG: zinc ribbon domain-containing protein [Anaerolineales bacterium]|nr:zinc ribbon domain-containing protein [Anaerolineales bacterium]